MLTRLTNFVIKGYQGYAIDKSMIKKVFSKRQSESEKRAMAEKNEGKIEQVNKLTMVMGSTLKNSMSGATMKNYDPKQLSMAEAIFDR